MRTVQIVGHELKESVRVRSRSSSGGSVNDDQSSGRARGSSFSNIAAGALSSIGGISGGSGGDSDAAGGRRRWYTVYELRARVGPFECTSFRRFSDFLRLHARLQRATAKDKPARIQLLAATPTASKLRESKLSLAPRAKQIESRKRLLQRYCAELCEAPELAQSELVTGFFWPNDGNGSVVAPDGSSGYMT